jgi:diguanylate cyclase
MLLMTHIAAPAFHDTPVVRVVEDGYRMRLLTFALGFIAAAAVLTTAGAGNLVLPAVLALNACVWPGLARAFALRSPDPQVVETRNLLIDSAMGGAWIALMQFNLLPCAVLTLVLTCNKVLVGGWSLVARGIVVQAAACVLMLALHGLTFAPQTSTTEILASLPLLFAYALVVSQRVNRLSGQTETPPAALPDDYSGSDTRIPLA